MKSILGKQIRSTYECHPYWVAVCAEWEDPRQPASGSVSVTCCAGCWLLDGSGYMVVEHPQDLKSLFQLDGPRWERLGVQGIPTSLPRAPNYSLGLWCSRCRAVLQFGFSTQSGPWIILLVSFDDRWLWRCCSRWARTGERGVVSRNTGALGQKGLQVMLPLGFEIWFSISITLCFNWRHPVQSIGEASGGIFKWIEIAETCDGRQQS